MEFGLQQIAPGEAGTDQTVQIISQRVSAALHRPTIRLKALQIVTAAGASSKTETMAAQAIYSWVKNNIRYVKDPLNLETIQDPEITLQLGAGDCDDQAALVSALMQSIGIEIRYRVVGAGDMLHIYPEIKVNNQWIGVDTTITGKFGTKPRGTYQKYYSIAGQPITPSERRENMRTQALNASLGNMGDISTIASTITSKITGVISSLFGPSEKFNREQKIRDVYYYTLRVLYNPQWISQMPANVQVMMNNDKAYFTDAAGRVGSQNDLNALQAKINEYAIASGIDFSVVVTDNPNLYLSIPVAKKVSTGTETGTSASLASMFSGSNLLPLMLVGGIVAFALFSSKPAPARRQKRRR